MTIYLSIQSILAAIAIVVGCLLGWLVHQGILQMLQSIIQIELPPAGPQPYVIGSMTALICLLSFALPPLLALRETPPLRVLRKDISQQKFGDKVPYIFGAIGTLSLVLWYSEDIVLTSLLVTSVAAIALFLSIISYLLLRTGGSVGMKAGSAWKLAMTATRRRRKQSVLQVMVFSITIMSLLILTLLRTDLIDEWQAQLPENTPNHFMMNITQPQIEGIQQFFEANGVAGNAFYPLISARVMAINGDLPDPQEDLNADTSGNTLTESTQLQEGEADQAETQSPSRAEGGSQIKGEGVVLLTVGVNAADEVATAVRINSVTVG